MSDRLIGFVLSSFLHASVFLGGEALLVTPAEYGVEQGVGALEVSLVAALPANEKGSDPFSLPNETTQKVPEGLNLSDSEKGPEKGSDPFSERGKDSTTLFSPGGAWTAAKPSYLKNAPPRYPEEARRRGEEGLVMLRVDVSEKGSADSVEVRRSSGFPLLDEAAQRAVRRWKFQPARVGALGIRSQADVPIRFQIEES